MILNGTALLLFVSAGSAQPTIATPAPLEPAHPAAARLHDFQNFIERSLIPLHTFEYLGKPFITVVTTNGSGEQEADKYLSKIGYLYGCIKVGSILKSDNDKFDQRAYDKLVQKTSSALLGRSVKPKLVNHMYFSSMRRIIKENIDYFKAESEIWHDRNWFNKGFNRV